LDLVLSIWQTGGCSTGVSRSNPEWRHEFQQTLPDLTDNDIAGSGLRDRGLHHASRIGGDAALARSAHGCAERGLQAHA
jgi:hypothetical protein